MNWGDQRHCLGPCREIKHAAEYYSDCDRICRSCTVAKARVRQPEDKRVRSRRKHLKKEYGLVPEQVVQMLESQDGKCPVCKVELTPPGSDSSSMCVDHCHTTNRVRALLCGHCNRALGFAKDNPDTLRAMARYVDEHVEREQQRLARIEALR